MAVSGNAAAAALSSVAGLKNQVAAPAEVLTRETQVREPVAAPRDRGQEMRFEDTTQSISASRTGTT